MSAEFFNKLDATKENSVILLHNHTDNRGASYTDLNTALKHLNIYASVMACNNGDIHYLANRVKQFNGGSVYDAVFDIPQGRIENELKKLGDYDKIKENTGRYQSAKEEICTKLIILDYFGGYK